MSREYFNLHKRHRMGTYFVTERKKFRLTQPLTYSCQSPPVEYLEIDQTGFIRQSIRGRVS